MARIEFTKGIKEDAVPDVRLTRSKDGTNGTATFYFQNPTALSDDYKEEITGMYMIDEEGELVTREVKGKFVNGKAEELEVLYIWKTKKDFDRFMRFMERYGEENGLGFNKS